MTTVWFRRPDQTLEPCRVIFWFPQWVLVSGITSGLAWVRPAQIY